MRALDRILVIQTAFIGDVVLTLPLVQALKDFFHSSEIDLVAVPRAADVCRNHPDLGRVIEYDKRGNDRGWSGFWSLVKTIRSNRYSVVFVPHRSLRSALLAFFGGIPIRVGFTRSAGRFLLTKKVVYEQDIHEVERNLSLLGGIGISPVGKEVPKLYPGTAERETVDGMLSELGIERSENLIALAPGTVWNTKRWMKERFAGLARLLVDEGLGVVLVGGQEDEGLGDDVRRLTDRRYVYNAAGRLSLLASAELISRCRIMVSNDSAPMHLAVAVGTPVVAVFGATVPAFGFGPYGKDDVVVETRGLRCRPCSKHGGERCPIGTFECMENISEDRVFFKVMDLLQKTSE